MLRFGCSHYRHHCVSHPPSFCKEHTWLDLGYNVHHVFSAEEGERVARFVTAENGDPQRLKRRDTEPDTHNSQSMVPCTVESWLGVMDQWEGSARLMATVELQSGRAFSHIFINNMTPDLAKDLVRKVQVDGYMTVIVVRCSLVVAIDSSPSEMKFDID